MQTLICGLRLCSQDYSSAVGCGGPAGSSTLPGLHDSGLLAVLHIHATLLPESSQPRIILHSVT